MKNLFTQFARGVLALFLFCATFTANAQSSSAQYEQNLELVKRYGLQPEKFWEELTIVTAIPRCSRNESAIADYIVTRATQAGLLVYRDKYNNVLVRVPGTPGYETYSTRIFQSHLDIVCETRNGAPMPPIKFVMQGDTLYADGTTLGADDGVGVAMMLCLMTGDMPHAPLELYFTAGEETGFTGAKGFDYTQLSKGVPLFNLDAERLGELVVGCAGYQMVQTVGVLGREAPVGKGNLWVLNLSGFQGGHSGTDINKNQGNALEELFILLKGLDRTHGARIVSLNGGGVVNTIPREASATIWMPEGVDVYSSCLIAQSVIREHYKSGMITVSTVAVQGENVVMVLARESQKALLSMLFRLPVGVIAMEDGGKLVRTSNNLGMLSIKGDTLLMKNMFRSSSALDLDSVAAQITRTTKGYDSKVIGSGAPWPPNFNSPFVAKIAQVYSREVGGELQIATIHAGTENGVFDSNMPGLQTVAIGCGVDKMHTPDEYLLTNMVEPWYKFVCALAQEKF